MEYKLIKSKRKTIAIEIKHGQLLVRAPKGCSKMRIDAFVNSKSQWINKKILQQNTQIELQNDFTLNYDSKIMFLGQLINVSDIISQSQQESFSNENSTSDYIKNQVKKYYKSRAKEYITNMVQKVSAYMDIEPSNVRITSAKTRWGSCNSKGNVNFSWYLMMASEAEIEYVVIHELAHIREMNHSDRFWKIVKTYMPEYKIHKKGLRELQSRLATENWD